MAWDAAFARQPGGGAAGTWTRAWERFLDLCDMGISDVMSAGLPACFLGGRCVHLLCCPLFS